MAGKIDLQPQVLDLGLYSGDGFSFKLQCSNSAGEPIDIGGVMKAEVRVDRLHPDDPPLQTFSINMTDAYLGIVVLSLTGDQTQSLTEISPQGTFAGVWDLEWTPADAEPRTICQGKVEVVADVTR